LLTTRNAWVYRDLKPANIQIWPDGKPKILDVGLARTSATDDPTSPQTESSIAAWYTDSGVILGTAPYMSPEQARGKVADKRTDVWVFGCCLYDALTGKTAFFGQIVHRLKDGDDIKIGVYRFRFADREGSYRTRARWL
jgi:serine/threonine protein kinase